MAKLRATLKHYTELGQLRAFFQLWYGIGWERKVELAAGLSRREISNVACGHRWPSKRLLPALRQLRARLEEQHVEVLAQHVEVLAHHACGPALSSPPSVASPSL